MLCSLVVMFDMSMRGGLYRCLERGGYDEHR